MTNITRFCCTHFPAFKLNLFSDNHFFESIILDVSYSCLKKQNSPLCIFFYISNWPITWGYAGEMIFCMGKCILKIEKYCVKGVHLSINVTTAHSYKAGVHTQVIFNSPCLLFTWPLLLFLICVLRSDLSGRTWTSGFNL